MLIWGLAFLSGRLLLSCRRVQPNPAGVLGYKIVRVAAVLSRQFEAGLSSHGLTATQFSVLAVLAQSPSITAAELARAVLVRPQSIGPVLDQLDELGLISRAPSKGRGYSNPIVISSAGTERLQSAYQAVEAQDGALRGVLGSARYEACLDDMQDIQDEIEGR